MVIDIENGSSYPYTANVRLHGIHGIAEYIQLGPKLSPFVAGLNSCFIASSKLGLEFPGALQTLNRTWFLPSFLSVKRTAAKLRELYRPPVNCLVRPFVRPLIHLDPGP